MRPVSLELEGFASYQTPVEINFDRLHLLAIVGQTGAGKSSILDAINFALWGKTRAGSLDTIVNTKAKESKVRFTFELEDRLYRASRVRVAGKNTGVTFETGIPDEFADVEWKPVGDGQIRGTDDEIRRVLGMDHETFAATVFLSQGDADRFTADSTPKARKEILADILGLDDYAQVAKAAHDEARRLRGALDTVTAQISTIAVEIADREQDEAALAAAVTASQEQAEVVADIASQMEDLQVKIAAIASSERTLADLRNTVEVRRAKRQDDRERAKKMLTSATTNADRLKKDRDRAEQRIAEAAESAKQAAELHTRQTAVTAERMEADKHLASITDDGVTVGGIITAKRSQAEATRQQIEDVNSRVEAAVGDSENPTCYTCGQPVTAEHRAELLDTLNDEISLLAQKLAHTESEIAVAENERRSKLDEHASVKATVEKLRAEETRLIRLYEQAQAVATSGTIGDLAEIDSRLDEAHEHLDTIRASLDDLAGDDPDEAILLTQIGAAEKDLGGATETRVRYAGLQRRYQETHEGLQRLNQEVGRLESRVDRYRTLQGRLDTLNDEAGDLLAGIRIQEHLASAFGRDGVPAMILNGVVAELDQVVNDVLTRLSNGSLGVRVETQKEKKSGGVTDTLEVIVSDGTVDRPYATFSGGERFKIDLALRVGLAKLLSRRSGTPIRTLAIDEGWGTLDPDGIQAMVECLHALSEDFDCLITISHVPAVYEAFASRFVVTKTAHGSIVERSVDS